MEEEVRKIGKAGWPSETGRVIFGVLTKLGGYPNEHSIKPAQHIKDILLAAPALVEPLRILSGKACVFKAGALVATRLDSEDGSLQV